MIIPTLGTGQLYQVHRNKQHMLNEMERKKAMSLISIIIGCIIISIVLWLR